MSNYNTCRFCKAPMARGLVKYGPRHYAHYECYLKAGKRLEDLPDWVVVQFPYIHRTPAERAYIEAAYERCKP